MENFLPFTDDVMVVLVHKCAQQTHLLALHLETLGYIPRLLNALNGLVYFLIIGDPRGDNLMVGSISRKLLTELGIRTEDAECKLKMKIQILKLDSQLISGFLTFIQIDLSLFSAGCRAGNTGVKVIPYSFRQTVSQSDLE